MLEAAQKADRCANRARAEALDPIGSAGCYEGYVLVTWPLPWPADVSDIAALDSLRVAAAANGLRLQLILPDPSGRAMAIVHHRPSGGFVRFDRYERFASTFAALPAVALDLIDTPSGSDLTPGVTDVLVCTHGKRDRCCGSLGTGLFLDLVARSWPSTVHVWRTSHSGGHRFAPTVLFLPTGTAWAYADPQLVEDALHREPSSLGMLSRYRGCAGLGSPQAQVLERRALAERGWSVLDAVRRWSALPTGTHRLEVEGPSGTEAWDGVVKVGRTLTLPPCGAPGPTGKPVAEWTFVIGSCHSEGLR